MTTHIQSIHEGVMYSCNQCNSTFSEKSNLTKGMKAKHKGVKYLFDQCEYIATHKSHLMSHCIFVTTVACYPAYSAYDRVLVQSQDWRPLRVRNEVP